MAPGWRIELLGGLRVLIGDRSVTRFRTQKTASLLAYLAYYAERPHRREELVDLLWPDDDPEGARNSLSRALTSLRQALEADAPAEGPLLVTDRITVQLNEGAATTDVAAFRAALATAERESDPDRQLPSLNEVVGLYRGPLLAGHHDDWVLREREWIAEAFFQALHQLLAHVEGTHEWLRAVQLARRGVNADPLREDAHRDLIRLLALSGRRDQALRQYRELERLLQQELGIAPAAATRALVRDLQAASPPTAADPRIPDPLRGCPARNATAHARPSTFGLPDDQSPTGQAEGLAVTDCGRSAVVILYERQTEEDVTLMERLAAQLEANGVQVFADRQLSASLGTAREIERQVRSADAVIPLLSMNSVGSEMLQYQVQIAREVAEASDRPRLIPLCLGDMGAIPQPFASLLAASGCVRWQNPSDPTEPVEELLRALAGTAPLPPWPTATPAVVPGRLEPVGGAVPLTSPFYVARPMDAEFHAAITARDGLVLLKGARQMGKTSLLARGLQQARQAGARVVLTDFQMLGAAELTTPEAFFLALAEWIAAQLDLETVPREAWNASCGPGVNLQLYLRRHVLTRDSAPLVWGLDEVDRLFTCSFGSEVFGLFRSWHNARSLDPGGLWANLTLVITYATEAHLFITDLSQSPFNVGTRLTLEDFTLPQVADLNQRYGRPLRSDEEVSRFHQLVSGQPYLVRRGLHEMATREIDLVALEAEADRDVGVFGDHLRRLLYSLARDPDLTDVVRSVLHGGHCPTEESFYRLRSAGVLRGESARDCRLRCQLYAAYLERHLG